jgi:hypothetical protein
MNQMAKSLGIDASRYGPSDEETMRLWRLIDEAIRGGVRRADEPLDGDPFAVFVTARCDNKAMHDGKGDHEYIAVIKTGKKVDEFEAAEILAQMKTEDNVNTCEVCQGAVTIWSIECTRMSTFAEKDKARRVLEHVRMT